MKKKCFIYHNSWCYRFICLNAVHHPSLLIIYPKTDCLLPPYPSPLFGDIVLTNDRIVGEHGAAGGGKWYPDKSCCFTHSTKWPSEGPLNTLSSHVRRLGQK